ncbi:MAG: type II toxin-antitoxin system VapC family toxin [Patescibacteria group bacterium]
MSPKKMLISKNGDILGKAVLADSNIIIASLDSNHPDFSKAEDLLTEVQDLHLKIVLTDLILSEVSTFLLHNSLFEELYALFDLIEENQLEIIPFENGKLSQAKEIIKERSNGKISFCDYYSMILIKSSNRYYKKAILSLDEHFKGSRLFIDVK